MAIETKLFEVYKNYGRCLEISNGTICIMITVDVGPRIIKCGFINGINVLYNDIKREVLNKGEAYDKYYYKDAYWTIYGGHRLWASPESEPETYYPDNNPVEYELIENGAIFTQEPQKENGVQFKIKVTMDEDNNINLEHYITNISNETKVLSPWAITVLNKGGLEIIPQNPEKKGLLPNRRIIMWPYADMSDNRVYFGKDYITLKQDENAKCAYKMGMDNRNGYAMYVLEDAVFVKNYTHFTHKEYDDFGVSFETYTNNVILEMETLGYIHTLKSGETATHSEKWSLFKNKGTPDANDEKQIDEFVKSYIK